MRRIVAILLVAFIIFWIAYGLLEPWRNIVNGVAINVVGPTIYNGFSGFVNWIIATIGIPGLVAIVAIPVFIIGVVAHAYWVKGDWWLRRKFASRTANQLGTSPVTQFPATTPPGATTRPAATTPVQPIVEKAEPVLEETAEEPEQ